MGKQWAITILLAMVSSSAVAELSNPSELVEKSQLSPKDVGQRYSPKVDATEVQARSEQLPIYRVDDKGSSQDEIEQANKDVMSRRLIQVSDPGREGASRLERNPAGVPAYDFFDKKTVKSKSGQSKVVKIPKKEIPRLDIGEEPRISRSDFMLPELRFSLAPQENAKPLVSPAGVDDSYIKKLTEKKIAAVGAVKEPKELKTVKVEPKVTKESAQNYQVPITAIGEVALKEVKELSEDEKKMLTAMILYNKKDRCPTIMGLFFELAEKKEFADKANYHLGACSVELKLYSEAYARLVPFVESEHQEYGSQAIKLLLSGLEGEYEDRFSRVLSDLKNLDLIPEDAKDKANLVMAKGAFKRGKLDIARQHSEKVADTSALYPEAQYLLGLTYYSEKNEAKARSVWEALRTYMAERGIENKNLLSLTALNLARLEFNEGDFKEAQNLYMKINKDHPVWVRGLIEQGWTQLAQDDFAGAIGNMYSLHSPYFRTVYKPESFAVRTIGYINICQYGDAYRTLSWLERQYRPWQEKVSTYMGKNKNDALAYYETMKAYLKGKSTDDVDGLPYQVIREMGRQKDFLNFQTALNQKEDEVDRYAKTGIQIIEKKRDIQWRKKEAEKRFAEVKANLKKAEEDKSLAANVSQWKASYRKERELIVGYHFQLRMLEEGRQGYRDFVKRAEGRIAQEKERLKKEAGEVLIAHMNTMKKEMAQLLDNNEFLRYEVFAGSGENIRYQVAGGGTEQPRRIPASVKPEKIMNWNFDGEFWEDEIGNYRSSLQNNCPNVARPQNKQDRSGDQASL